MCTVVCSDTSPNSTMRVLTTPRIKTHISPRRALAMKPIDKSVASTAHYGPSVMDNLEIPDINGGDIMPPLSLCVDADFSRVSVGIPTSKPSHQITKITKIKKLTDKNNQPETEINATSCNVGSADAPVLNNNPPPPMLTVACSSTSPASTMSVLTTRLTKTRQLLRLALAMRPIDEYIAITMHYGPSVMDNSEIPMVNGGDMMPPLSPCVDADFARVSVGIPKSNLPARSKNQ